MSKGEYKRVGKRTTHHPSSGNKSMLMLSCVFIFIGNAILLYACFEIANYQSISGYAFYFSVLCHALSMNISAKFSPTNKIPSIILLGYFGWICSLKFYINGLQLAGALNLFLLFHIAATFIMFVVHNYCFFNL